MSDTVNEDSVDLINFKNSLKLLNEMENKNEFVKFFINFGSNENEENSIKESLESIFNSCTSISEWVGFFHDNNSKISDKIKEFSTTFTELLNIYSVKNNELTGLTVFLKISKVENSLKLIRDFKPPTGIF